MGIITLVLVAGGFQESGTAPHLWVILAAGLAIALGTYSGGWRIMRTMGKGMADIEAPQGFAAETSAMAAILASSHLGFGLSTTHVVSGAVMGAGLGRTPDEVRWNTAVRMMVAWLLTLPAAGVVGGLTAVLAHQGAVGFIAVLVILVAFSAAVKVLSHRNHVSSENVNDSHEVKVLARQETPVPARGEAVPQPLASSLPDHIQPDHPMVSTPLVVVPLKNKKLKRRKNRKPAETVKATGDERIEVES
jgi:PiT family inorganic phosphate transporter